MVLCGAIIISFIDLSTAFCISNQWYMKDSFVVRLISIVLSVIVTSFYFFTFKFTYFGGANTKTVLAGVALLLLLFELAKNRRQDLSKDLLILTVYSVCYIGIILCSIKNNGRKTNQRYT